MTKRRSRKLSHEEEEEMLREMDQYQNTKALTENQRLFNNIHIKINNVTPGQKDLIKQIKDKEIVFCTGMAGTGKTYISCAMALDMIKKYPEKYKKIVLIKSVTTLQEEEIGFLKGTMEEKMEPFMYSFMTNFEKLVGRSTLTKLKSDGLIEIRPIAYLRGSNIDNTVTIIDEAQNISKKNIRTILTRIGRDAKMIFLGDTNQIDMKKPHESSLAYMIENFKDFEEVGFVQMTDADEARHPLIPKLEKRFTEIEEKQNSKK